MRMRCCGIAGRGGGGFRSNEGLGTREAPTPALPPEYRERGNEGARLLGWGVWLRLVPIKGCGIFERGLGGAAKFFSSSQIISLTG